jgi:hypothetical protein
MATFSKQLLSASTDGRAIKVVATAIGTSPTLIHTGSSTASTFEEVWIYAQNNHSADVALRLGFGGVTDPDDIIEYTIKTKGGLYLVVPGLILKGNASAALTIRAAAGTTNVISLSGYVNRITA